jgi:hypothetical protein
LAAKPALSSDLTTALSSKKKSAFRRNLLKGFDSLEYEKKKEESAGRSLLRVAGAEESPGSTGHGGG